MKISKENKTQVLAFNHEDDELVIACPINGTEEYTIYNEYEVLDEMISELTCSSFEEFAGTNNLFLYTTFARLGENTYIEAEGLDLLDHLGLKEDAIKLTDEFFKD